MRPTRFDPSILRQDLRQRKIADLPDLKRVLGTDVNLTVFRKLKHLGYLVGSLEQTTAEMDVTTVLPGHGPLFEGHRELIEKRLDMHARRARRILRSVNGARTATDIIAILWRNLPVTQSYLALSEVLGHIDLLERDGLVRAAERDDGVIVWERA